MDTDEARKLAEQWAGEKEAHDINSAVEARFSGFEPRQLLEMWETRKNEHGRRLSKFEGEALACALYRVFGEVPGAVAGERGEVPPMPADEQMLTIKEVAKLTTKSVSTIKRQVALGLFPRPLRHSPRRKAWLGRDIRLWREQLEDIRRNEERRYYEPPTPPKRGKR